MTIRKTFTPALATVLTSALLVTLSGCGMIGSVMEQDRVDYRGAKKATKLDVPPDLTQLEKDNRYAIPEGRGSASASTYRQAAGTPAAAAEVAGQPVGPISTDAMRVERAGNQRWLVVNQSPEQLFPVLKQFWIDNGFAIAAESATTGTIETEWTENRAKIPQDAVRRTLGKVIDSLYGTGERDKYRTRLERTATGGTEVYISHRGAEEVLTGPNKEIPTWTGRANDPELEAQFLSKLVARLSGATDARPWSATPWWRRSAPSWLATSWKWTKGSTAPGAVSAWRWTGSASPSKTAIACRACTLCASSIRTSPPRKVS